MNTYFNPVRTFQGYGSLSHLEQLVEQYADPQKSILLLVWHADVLHLEELEQLCIREEKRLLIHCFSASNPELEQLYEMYRITRDKKIGMVIAVGGGSVLDVGKSLCCLYGKGEELSNPEDLRQLIASKDYGSPACRWIGIPTTAGTGSEVTCWATIWDPAKGVKHSIDTQSNYACAAIADPQLIETLPLPLAVSSALDAAAHAAESYWAKAANTVSRALALEAIRIIMGQIDHLLEKPSEREAHDAMSRGSMLAGLAFSNTRTTACHSISYPLTMQYHIPHGVAVSLLLGPVLLLNRPALRDMDALLNAFGLTCPQELGKRITEILAAAGHPVKLRDWGVSEEMLPSLAAHSMTKGRADNNPVQLTEKVVHNILKKLM
ncbi:MAG: phosphonoacetaldehyde reductase [Lachnospiraceae bacterium]|nr:phosphonoacetaldehyde reductase [Lachnospiraceae bacterium]